MKCRCSVDRLTSPASAISASVAEGFAASVPIAASTISRRVRRAVGDGSVVCRGWGMRRL